MARKTGAAGNTRRQATRLAVLAFVAADCVGIWYAQQRLSQPSPVAAQFAYQTPGAMDQSAPGGLTFTAGRPSLAVAAPLTAAAAVPAVAAAAPVAAPAAAAPVHAAPALASAAPAAAAPLPVLAAAPALPRLAAAPAKPAPKAAAAAARPALAAEAPHHTVQPAAAASPFDNAFALDGEAPDAEQRFGQGTSDAGGLADLLTPRDEPTPIFDKAGIAPVTGQAATVDAPADQPVPVDAAPADQPAIKG